MSNPGLVSMLDHVYLMYVGNLGSFLLYSLRWTVYLFRQARKASMKAQNLKAIEVSFI